MESLFNAKHATLVFYTITTTTYRVAFEIYEISKLIFARIGYFSVKDKDTGIIRLVYC